MRLQGRLAIVTAAASGMGRAGVERFVREGAQVAAIDIDPAALGALVAEFGSDRVTAIIADLSTPEGARGGGSIIFTSSISGLVGSMMSPIYSAAKWGVVGLAKSLALALAPDGIRVNVVCPGLADTPMKLGFTGRSGDPAEAAANEAKIVAAVPLGRLVKPGEVADAALWLASDEASFVTGVALPVDGGFTAR
jgi:NAD(P)-dependent dehydrogenase (short-subunit alcohol dehydrogenase family)